MLTKENFGIEHINDLRKLSQRDPGLIERVLFAFGLLEALRRVELPFVFKGGTSLLLILEKPMRLSTDIDIVVEPDTPIDEYLEKAAKIFPFKEYEEQVRKGRNGIEKRHFKFRFDSPRMGETVEIILDILFEKHKYVNIIEKNIDCELLLTEPEYMTVKLPDVNSILADKMTAFAPHTTGVLINSKKDLEIMKQMFDVYMLANAFTNFDVVCKTYRDIVAAEIAYREIDIHADDVLMDTYNASLCVASRGILYPEDYKSYLKGIRSLTGHIYSLEYSAEIASTYAPIIMYLSACLMKGIKFERITNPEEYLKRVHMDKNVTKALKAVKKRDPLAYAWRIPVSSKEGTMKKRVMMFTAILLAMVFAVLPMQVEASESTAYTYTQSVDKEWIRTQDAYMPGRIFLNDGSLAAPEDLFIYGNLIYIADTTAEGGRIVIYDMETNATKTIGEGVLVNPMGVFVNKEAVFVADKGAQAVFKLSHEGEVLLKLGRPDSYLFSERSQYLPSGVAVSSQGIIFVCGEGAYEGLMQFDSNGVFQGYFAANATKMSFSDRVKELIFNEDQMNQLLNRIPAAIYNMDISDRDLIYSVTQLEANSLWTVASQTENAVKYHNMAGTDILSKSLIEGEHNFADVAAYRDGLSFAVTSTGIIYEYDETGNVIFSFGGLSSTERSGHFVNATAIDVDAAGNIYILDRENKYFQMFFPTDFANATHEALYNLRKGSYAASEDIWLELLSLNGMSYIAHQGYGKVLYQQMRFKEAAEEFKIIGDKSSYSECIWELRNNWLQSNLPYILVVLIVLFVVSFVISILKKKGILKARKAITNPILLKLKKNWSYMVHMLKNPFDELYDLKKKNHGSVLSATVLFVLAFGIYLMDMFGRSFSFTVIDTKNTQLLSVAVMFLVPAILWVIGNYMVSAISEGEGSFRSVYVATAYSLVPYIIITPIIIVLTYVLTLNEAVIIHYFWAIGVIWAAALICIAVKEIHNYTVKETIKIIALTLFFMIMAIVVCVILYLIGQQVVIFIQDIINEVTYHV